MQVFINNNARFCYQSKKKYCPQTLLEEYKYEQEKIKMENVIDDDLGKSESDESDNDSNDKTESDDESNEQFINNNKSLIVCVNHALLGFCLFQSI